MVERRPWLTALSHAVLIVGVLVVAFPLYLTFVASTHTVDAIIKAPMPLWRTTRPPGMAQVGAMAPKRL
jgi:sn-glycerol 3-phosphate transport system permease protein